MTETVQSADGTPIAYERVGAGPPLIAVGGAFSTRRSAGVFADVLAPHFEVFVYDRRGRGDSGDTPPYAIEREIEDLGALIGAAGGSVCVYGHSSGAVLALEAASRALPISRLAVYEPPYTADSDDPAPASIGVESGDDTVQAALDAGDRELAATRFMRLTGMPDEVLDGVRHARFWPGMVAIAHTLVYDLAFTGDGVAPVARLGAIAAPTLVMDGGASPAWAARAAEAVARAVPHSRRITVPGQDHGVDPAVLAPLLTEFFG